MTVTYGMTPQGFVVMPFDVIVSQLEAAYRALIAASLDTSSESVAGIQLRIHAEREAFLWELCLAIWNARNPDFAFGVSLVELAGISGTLQQSPKRSAVANVWTGTPGVVIPAGRIVSVSGNPTAKFRTKASATVPGGGTISVDMESVEYGAIAANAGTLTVIETPVGGISGTTNPLDAVPGRAQETDASLRLRRELELRAEGEAAVAAIEATVSQVSGVSGVTVFNNPLDLTDVDGIPPHAVEPMVQGGDDQDIREAIWAAVAGGIYTHGSTVGTITDSQGQLQTIRFTRPAEKDIQVELSFDYVASEYPADGDAEIKTAVVAAAQARFGTVGKDVILSMLDAPLAGISGVYDVTLVRASISPAALGTVNVAIAPREFPAFDTSRVTLIKNAVVGS